MKPKEYIEIINKASKMTDEELLAIPDDEIAELGQTDVDINLPKIERMMQYVEKVKNPFIYKYKGRKVIIRYSERADKTIQEAYENLIKLKIRLANE